MEEGSGAGWPWESPQTPHPPKERVEEGNGAGWPWESPQTPHPPKERVEEGNGAGWPWESPQTLHPPKEAMREEGGGREGGSLGSPLKLTQGSYERRRWRKGRGG